MHIEKNVIGFQFWLNGEPAGYQSVKSALGVELASETDCRENGYLDGAGMAYEYDEISAAGIG
jgi:hypothetical protein